MKSLATIALLLFIFGETLACSFACAICHNRPFDDNDVLFSGKIIEKGDEYCKFEIIEVFRGTEKRDVVTVWSGTDFDCNGNFSMSANAFGQVGDSLMMLTKLIQEKENDWDVFCDYRRSYYCIFPIKNKVIHNFWIPNPYLPYDMFKANWENQTLEGCSNYVAASESCEPEEPPPGPVESFYLHVAPNPASNNISIKTDNYQENNITAQFYDIAGRLLRTFTISSFETVQNISAFPAGIYIIAFRENGKYISSKKIVIAR